MPTSWLMHITCVAPASARRAPGARAGDRLVLADVGDRADLLVDVGAGVDGDDRDARLVRRGERVLRAPVVGHRHDETVGFVATAASMSDDISTMSNVAGAE